MQARMQYLRPWPPPASVGDWGSGLANPGITLCPSQRGFCMMSDSVLESWMVGVPFLGLALSPAHICGCTPSQICVGQASCPCSFPCSADQGLDLSGRRSMCLEQPECGLQLCLLTLLVTGYLLLSKSQCQPHTVVRRTEKRPNGLPTCSSSLTLLPEGDWLCGRAVPCWEPPSPDWEDTS